MPRPRRTIEPVDTPVEAEILAAPQRTPQRQALADMFAAIATLEAELAAADATVAEGEAAYYTAAGALDAAEKVLTKSRPREEETFGAFPPLRSPWGGHADVEAIVADAAILPVPIADAKAAVDAATDAKDSAKRLVQHHREHRDKLHASLDFKRRHLLPDLMREAIGSDPALMALATASRRLATRAAAARRAFEAATNNDSMPFNSPFYGCTYPAEPEDGPEAFADWQVHRDWRAALDALRTDPDAVLPMPA